MKKFGEILRFELRLQLTRASTWLYFAITLGITFRLATEGYIGIAKSGGFYWNGPFVIASLMLTGGLLVLFAGAAITGDAAARDVQLRMHPLFYCAPISKTEYLGGRFVAAFVLNLLLALAVPLALLIAPAVSAMDPEIIGPFRPWAYLSAYLFIAAPNAFLATSLLFAGAALSRRAMVAYFGSVLLFMGSILSVEFLAKQLGMWGLAKLMDPFGLIVLSEISRAWTPAEKSVVIIGPQSAMIANRLLWIAVGLAVLAFTHRRFRFAHPVAGRPLRHLWRKRDASAASQVHTSSTPIAVPVVRGGFSAAARARQTVTIMLESFREVALGWGGLITAGMVVFLVVLSPSLMTHMGVPLLPSTQHMTAIFTSGDLIWLFIPLLTIFYAGELVWRERDAGMSDIADAAPVPAWALFTGKFMGLALALVAVQTLMIAAAVLIQMLMGYYRFEIGIFAQILLGLRLADYLQLALIVFAVHALVNQKYVGHLAGLMIYMAMVFAPMLGFENHLLIFGGRPEWTYSDILGFGSSVAPFLWLKAYWFAWSLLFALAALMLWVRGREQGLRVRMAHARRNLTARMSAAVAGVAVLVLTLGGFVFYNTNALNESRSAEEWKDQRAEYERRYGHYESRPQPAVVATTLNIEIYPQRREAQIRGSYRLVNLGAAAIDTIYITTATQVETEGLAFNRRATIVVRDETFGHHAYVLATPLAPGDSLRLDFHVRFRPRGFTKHGVDASVTAKGTYFEPADWLPAIGYQRESELSDASDRRARGLPARASARPLEAGAAPEERAERIVFEAIVATDEGQVAFAPGRLLRSWSKDGRRYAHYRTDVPISNDYAIISSDYAVHKTRWKDVEIEIVHDPAHTHNLERMARSLQASLAYMSREFGTYPHKNLRLVEHAGDGSGLHAFPVNITYEEGFSLFNADADKRDVDFPFAVVAHEVAHQWWGHVVVPAGVEGGGLLSESLAWFSALAVVEETYGPEHMERFIDVMREAYLAPRARADVPLLRAHDWFGAYRKGPFAMYALREYVGEDRVNIALRRMVALYGAGQPPLPTSLDLYRELRAVTPDSLRNLLTDLFEVNTFWELETTRATADSTGDGTWRVTLDVQARKVAVDSVGTETVLPMNDLVEVGVYGTEGGQPLYLGMHRIRSGEQRIVVTVPVRPGRAGIDPRRLLIDTDGHDNIVDVARSGRPGT